eukprot:TRINITY_DN35926_c0_g1_i1.p1 TRINITY_DN35926_c0_g1~~TRINITY_DN35926_c0_g1_i1.p1  ORF type:complete len:197 (-),score=28.96 TRINITY_DN35926_c0_g1_i1:214-804(-)
MDSYQKLEDDRLSPAWWCRTIAWTAYYHVAWTMTALLAAACWPWCACLPMLSWAAARCVVAYQSHERIALLWTVGAGTVIGYAADAMLFSNTWAHAGPIPCANMPGPDPLWMVSLWIGFAAVVDWMLELFAGRPVLCLILGGVFGPLAYLAGERLGCLVLDTPGAVILVALEYAVCFPLLVEIAARASGPVPCRPV